ncbi:GGDEF domain-containing protein [Comamonas composti]|uniref:GGDEF domain-containing protein n=1 Tax=Comamonas composti TaxID=408558 RepID=UPI0003FB9CCE|nr:GGDEF domain-containing protein [Comamonas composti]
MAVALSAAVCNMALMLFFHLMSKGQPYLPIVAVCWVGFTLIHLLHWAWIRRHPRQLVGTSLRTGLFYCSNLCVTALWLPPDPLLPIWLILQVIGAFIMLGRIWGWGTLGLTLGASLWLLGRLDLSAYPNVYETLCFTMFASALMGHIYVARFYYLYDRLQEQQQALQLLASYDPLTHALNARAYYEQSNAQLHLCQRLGLPVSVLFVDLDHFKSINDNYGHAMGDHVLRQAGMVLRECLRESDLLGRVGGEEFSIFLPNTALESARNVGENIRAALESLPISFHEQVLRVTASIGVSCSPAHCDPPPLLERLQQRADQAMYEAKHSGRNRVVCEGFEAVAMS